MKTTTDWRMKLVMACVRSYERERTRDKKHRSAYYDRTDLISHLFVVLCDYINANPLADNAAIREYGVKAIRKWVRPYKDRVIEQKIERPDRRAFNCSEGRDSEELLSMWCAFRHQRSGLTMATRLVGYLHLVEGFPLEEIAEIFGRTRNAIVASLYALKKRKVMLLKKNDVVMLVMDNPFFHEMLGWVKEPTEFGAIVEVESHCYPERVKWELRCLHAEMVYIGSVTRKPDAPQIPASVDGSKYVVSNAQAVHKGKVAYSSVESVPLTIPTDPQFTGDECSACGKMMMVRAGTCLTCISCGTTTGC